jgi:hypothetical protein
VLIGRTSQGEEVVALYTETKDWTILSRGGTNHEQLLLEKVTSELQRLTDKIAVDIRRLK